MSNDPLRPGTDEIARARAFRQALHRAPEVSRAEAATAARVAREMDEAGADEVWTGLGGHGVAAVFAGRAPGPTVILRAELDALPIAEESGVAHRSEHHGTAHLCGHDGHMAILAAVALVLGRARPARGRVVLLFQPAEEDGSGARAVLEDPRIAGLEAHRIFALHNLPGLPLGQVALAEGWIACASRGMRVRLTGRAAHASSPQTGLSPLAALAHLMTALPGLGNAAPFPSKNFNAITVTHVSMGARAFGIAPGEGEILATLRTLRDDTMDALVARAETCAREAAAEAGLGCEIAYEDVFDACRNDPDAVADLQRGCARQGIAHAPEGQPWRPLEDFGQFGQLAPAAMLFLGAGAEHPPLHDPRYDFPDALIETGARIFLGALADVLG